MTVDYTLIDLPYLEDHTQCYARLADLPGFVLLESGDRSRGRYDIVTACPTKRFYCSEYANVDDYLVQLEEALPSYLLPVDLPFQGGLIGYFSYDLGAHRLGIEIPENTSLSPAESCLADFGLFILGSSIGFDQFERKTIGLVCVWRRHRWDSNRVGQHLIRGRHGQ